MFVGKFRIIVNEPIPQVQNLEQAKKAGEEMAKIIFREHPEFEYVELASVEEKMGDLGSPRPFSPLS